MKEKKKPLNGVITCTMGDLIRAEEVMPRVLAILKGQAGYDAAKLTRLIKAETAHFHEQREILIKELGAERDTTKEEVERGMGKTVTAVLPENLGQFAARMEEFKTVEVEIAWKPIAKESLTEITGDVQEALMPLIGE